MAEHLPFLFSQERPYQDISLGELKDRYSWETENTDEWWKLWCELVWRGIDPVGSGYSKTIAENPEGWIRLWSDDYHSEQ